MAIAAGVGLVFVVLVGAALATPGIGILDAPPPILARGTLDDDLVVNSKTGIHLKTKGSVDVATQKIRIAVGGSTGWHSHPGPVLVTIRSGTMRLVYADDESCQGTIYETGDSFVDRGDENVHNAWNAGTTELELWATYLVPGTPATTGVRIDATPAPSSC